MTAVTACQILQQPEVKTHGSKHKPGTVSIEQLVDTAGTDPTRAHQRRKAAVAGRVSRPAVIMSADV